MSIDAITISITRNGRKIRNPISNAVFNSDVIKAGKTIGSGMDCLSKNGPLSDRSANKFSVSTRVFVTMNSFKSAKPSLKAWFISIFPSRKGVIVST